MLGSEHSMQYVYTFLLLLLLIIYLKTNYLCGTVWKLSYLVSSVFCLEIQYFFTSHPGGAGEDFSVNICFFCFVYLVKLGTDRHSIVWQFIHTGVVQGQSSTFSNTITQGE